MTTGRLPTFRIGRHHPRPATLDTARAYCREVMLVTPADLSREAGWCHETASTALSTLAERGEVVRVRRGLYRLAGAA